LDRAYYTLLDRDKTMEKEKSICLSSCLAVYYI